MIEYYQKLTAREPLGRLKTPRNENIWVHTSTASDLDEIITHYNLDRNIVYDVQDERELTRVEVSDHTLYVFMRKIEREHDGHAISGPILAVITPSSYLTLSPHTSFSPTIVSDKWVPQTSKKGTLLLATILMVISEYEARVHDAGEKIRTIRNRLKTHEVSNEDFILFVSIEDNLNHYQQNLDGLLSVMRRLKENRQNIFSAHDLETIDDMLLHIEQISMAVKSYNHSVNSIQTAYSTIANNRLNHRMKALTVFTVLLTLPNVFYGMFGMNVALPYQEEPWAYSAIVGVTALIIVVIYILAKRKRLF